MPRDQQTLSGISEEFEFGLILSADDRLDPDLVRGVIADVDGLLRILERTITGREKARAHWEWMDYEVPVGLAARVNGASAETLEAVTEAAYRGFAAAASAAAREGGVVEWPAEFVPAARERIQRVLRTLDRLSAITVQTRGRPTLEIHRAVAGEVVVAGRQVRRVWSSVEGVLRMLSGGGRVVRARIQERGTGASVRASFDYDDWHEKLRGLWDQRVIVEGRVAYAPDGRAVSIADVTRVDPRGSGRSIREFAGVFPDLRDADDDDESGAE